MKKMFLACAMILAGSICNAQTYTFHLGNIHADNVYPLDLPAYGGAPGTLQRVSITYTATIHAEYGIEHVTTGVMNGYEGTEGQSIILMHGPGCTDNGQGGCVLNHSFYEDLCGQDTILQSFDGFLDWHGPSGHYGDGICSLGILRNRDHNSLLPWYQSNSPAGQGLHRLNLLVGQSLFMSPSNGVLHQDYEDWYDSEFQDFIVSIRYN